MTRTARTPADVRASVLKTLEDGIASLEACAVSLAGDDTILAWTNGLAVKMVDGKPVAISIDRADAFEPRRDDFAFPVVTNGHRETARPMLRREAAARQIADLRVTLADLAGRLDISHA